MSDNDYYPYPWQIYYSRWQIEWLFRNWDIIQDEKWPFSIQDDAMRCAGVSHHAAFEKISLIKAEVEARLDCVGKDGDMCLLRFHNGVTAHRIASLFDLHPDRVNTRIKRAMRYMTGKREIITYNQWIANGWNSKPRRCRAYNGGDS